MANSHTVHNNQPTRQRIYTSQQNIPTNLHAQSSLNLNINTFNFNFADLGERRARGVLKLSPNCAAEKSTLSQIILSGVVTTKEWEDCDTKATENHGVNLTAEEIILMENHR